METYRKPKKITIKFFLNQLLEPAINDKGKESYPLYIQITYNRKNMQLKSKYAEYYYSLSEGKPALMEFEEKVLRKIIFHEAAHTEDDYDLKGLKRKYDVYSYSIHQVIEDYLKPRLRLAVLKTNDELANVLDFNSALATVPRLLAAGRRLFPGFDRHLGNRLEGELAAYSQFLQLDKAPLLTYTFPTVIDWVDGSYQMELDRKLNTIYKEHPNYRKHILSLIEHAMTEKLKQLDQ